jgi:hypothetical protein
VSLAAAALVLELRLPLQWSTSARDPATAPAELPYVSADVLLMFKYNY